MRTATQAVQAAGPAATWKALAPLIAARPTMRVWDPTTEKFDRKTTLSTRLPCVPAAVPLYLRQRTQLLAFDFDAKHHGAEAVDRDFTAALTWITEAGGLAVSDRSTSGGRHILVPLALGTSATLAEIATLMRLLEARLPTLDKTPMVNTKTGCITVPGSVCREGGFRQLDGSLDAAIETFSRRSEPALLPRLYALLGALTQAVPSQTHATVDGNAVHQALTGSGVHRRLNDEYARVGEIPQRIIAYATAGDLRGAGGAWPSHSEARQSVLAHAALHGYSLAAVQAQIAPGRPWHTGLGRAYQRYHGNADAALERDFSKALTWAATNIQFFRPVRAQEQIHTGGRGGGSPTHRRWLVNATAWVEREFSGHRYRWIGAAVYQALAVHAVRAGAVINGVPVVGVGGRSLSLATGLLSETTVWEFLRETRDLPGSPIVRTRIAQGREPDYYALTHQHPVDVSGQASAAVRVEDVHMAWKIVGHRHRRVYEVIAHGGVSAPKEVFAAARLSPSTGYSAVAALCTAGLITRRRGQLSVGSVHLDDIAAAHMLDQNRVARIARHQRERQGWHLWLDQREDSRERRLQGSGEMVAAEHCRAAIEEVESEQQAYLSSVLATGPPRRDDEDEEEAKELLAEHLGARLISVA